MAFRFVHTADVHLDSPLGTLALRDPQSLCRGDRSVSSRITGELTLPESVKVFAGRAEAVALTRRALEVAVRGAGFAHVN
jgi:hypothetical protein